MLSQFHTYQLAVEFHRSCGTPNVLSIDEIMVDSKSGKFLQFDADLEHFRNLSVE